jgi:hypothetical protein
VTETVWHLRQALTGSLTETIIAHAHHGAYRRQQIHGPQCDRRLNARGPVRRTVETLVGSVQLERPYCYWPDCHGGLYPLDKVLGLLTTLILHQSAKKAKKSALRGSGSLDNRGPHKCSARSHASGDSGMAVSGPGMVSN